mmetsp:Transcript_8137/g.12901  ORF Transcript_8137/g.12901 Transcript_8137/m.12901 type:complete len:190 (+) Transcript_8137:22-591(+)
MTIGKFHKKIASEILGCGKRKVWMDPNETYNIGFINSRSLLKKAIKNGSVLKKLNKLHSRDSVKKNKESKINGRHSNEGKREGTKNSRSNFKNNWIFKLRVLRRLLKRYRKESKIDRHLYRELYLKCKGNVFKNKRTLMDFIFKARSEKERRRIETFLLNKRKEKQKNLRMKKIEKFNLKVQKVYNQTF